MPLFHRKHNSTALKTFQEVFEAGKNETESEFLDSLNEVVRVIEVDKSFTTNEKLHIYELLSQRSNCSPQERQHYAKKLSKALR